MIPKQFFLACFYILSYHKAKFVKRKNEISRTSITDIIYLMMSNTGMTREQAATTIDSILAYMKQHSTDPLARLTKLVFGLNNDNKNATLN
jgi:putative ribosome biogenesis GTPase RsgA